jgi:hypothetical protein
MSFLHQKVRLDYTVDSLPLHIANLFTPRAPETEGGWTTEQILNSVGLVDDEVDGELIVLYEEGPAPRVGVRLKTTDVKVVDPESQPETKIYLREVRTPVVVTTDIDEVRDKLWPQTEGDVYAPGPVSVQFHRPDGKRIEVLPDEVTGLQEV